MIEEMTIREIALRKVSQGAEKWNQWNRDNSDEEIDFSNVTFDKKNCPNGFKDFVFSSSVKFNNCHFESEVIMQLPFKNSRFEKAVNFQGAVFNGATADFSGSYFLGDTNFRHCVFDVEDVNFEKTVFKGSIVSFRDVQFGRNKETNQTHRVNFRDSSFKVSFLTFWKATFACSLQIDFGGGLIECNVANFSNVEIYRGNFHFSLKRLKADEFRFNGSKLLSEYASFSGVKFECNIVDFSFLECNCRELNFAGSCFNGSLSFRNSIFSIGRIDFGSCYFAGENTDFDGVALQSGQLTFEQSLHTGKTSFSGGKFFGSLNFEHSDFSTPPDFRRTQISSHFSFHEMTIEPFDESKTERSTEDKYRRLKEIAIQSRDHEKELEFFAKELKTKNYWETNFFRKIPVWAYDNFSDFGRSLWRPFVGLSVIWFAFGTLYWLGAMFFPLKPLVTLANGLKLSSSALFPFIPTSRPAFLDGGVRNELFDDPGLFLDLVNYTESFLGIVFLFLIGLALRNRFRL